MCPLILNILSTSASEASTPRNFFANLANSGNYFSKKAMDHQNFDLKHNQHIVLTSYSSKLVILASVSTT
jgi:hypothetical protein